jgi:hypothetical protein
MTQDEIERISRCRGDSVEEFWKPTLEQPNKHHVDVFWFWEFRERLLGCELKILRPAGDHQTISERVLYKHERLAGYYYTSFCRIAGMHDKLFGVNKILENRGPQPVHFFMLDLFESFYLMLGSALDMIGGVGNIMYGFQGSEDSFHNFVTRFEALNNRTSLENEALMRMRLVRNVQENLRAQIAHRPRISSVVDSQTGRFLVQKDFNRAPQPENNIMWRKTLREINEGRAELIPLDVQMHNDLALAEDTVNYVFHFCTERIADYLAANGMRISTDADNEPLPTEKPAGAKYLLAKCLDCGRGGRIHLDTWLHRAEIPFESCLNEDCLSRNIRAYYYVSE